MSDVQNLRKAIFEYVLILDSGKYVAWDSSSSYKLKVDASEAGSQKQKKLMDLGVNYLWVAERTCLASRISFIMFQVSLW
jgi:hypothetical protein